MTRRADPAREIGCEKKLFINETSRVMNVRLSVVGWSNDIAFPFQRDSAGRAAENCDFFAACFFRALCYTRRVKPLTETSRVRAIHSLHALERGCRGCGKSDSPENARAALAELCQTYWSPLYSSVRSRGYSVHDAQDLTQSFFAFLIDRKIYARADRQKGNSDPSYWLRSRIFWRTTLRPRAKHSSAAAT